MESSSPGLLGAFDLGHIGIVLGGVPLALFFLAYVNSRDCYVNM